MGSKSPFDSGFIFNFLGWIFDHYTAEDDIVVYYSISFGWR